MIKYLSNYANGLIYVIIIVGLMELILPNNKNKKYIKVIMGMVMILAIMNPVVGKDINIENNIIEKYMNIEEKNQISETISIENSLNINNEKDNKEKNENEDKKIKEIFITKTKESVGEFLESEGFECNNIIINEEDYKIKKIEITGIVKKENSMIKKVEINIEQNRESMISDDEKANLKKKLKETYGTEEVVID